jgi:hypothetical protein
MTSFKSAQSQRESQLRTKAQFASVQPSGGQPVSSTTEMPWPCAQSKKPSYSRARSMVRNEPHSSA